MRSPLACLLGTTLLALAGCGGPAAGHVNVGGTVLLDGKPLPTGRVTLYSESGSAGTGPVSSGSFRLAETGNTAGVKPGTYQVAVESWKVEPGTLLPNGRFSPGESEIPKKYASPKTSGLTAEVPKGGATLKFELSSGS